MDTARPSTDAGRPALVFVTYSGLGDLTMALPLFSALRPRFRVLPVIQPQHRDLARLFLEDGLLEDYLPIENNLSFRSDPMGHLEIRRALCGLRPEVVLIYGKRVLAVAAYLGLLPTGRALFCDPMRFALPATGSFAALAPTGNRTRDYLQFAEKLGLPSRPDGIGFSRGAVERMRKDARPHVDFPSYAVVAPWASATQRTPPLRFVRECIEIIVREGQLPVVVAGTPENRTAAAELLRRLGNGTVQNLVGATSVAEMLGLLAGARFLLAGDSGSLHLARLMGTPSLIVFGPTVPETLFPEESQGPMVPIRVSLPCSPCEFSSHRYRCPGSFLQCMNDLDAVAARSLLLDACQAAQVRNA